MNAILVVEDNGLSKGWHLENLTCIKCSNVIPCKELIWIKVKGNSRLTCKCEHCNYQYTTEEFQDEFGKAMASLSIENKETLKETFNVC